MKTSSGLFLSPGDHLKDRLTTRPKRLLYSPILISLGCSLATDDWSWFQRSGSLVALAVVLAELLDWLPRSALVVPAIIGTLTWGYGDLLGRWF